MIKFQVLVIKTETNDMHAILLLKKNVQTDIIKTILGYLPIVASESLRKWKVAIISVGQGYESTESQQDYRIGKKLYMEEKAYLWILRRPEKTLRKIESLNTSVVMYMDIWQRNAESQRMNETSESIISRTHYQILQNRTEDKELQHSGRNRQSEGQ